MLQEANELLRNIWKTILQHACHFTMRLPPQWGCAFLLRKEQGVCPEEHLTRHIPFHLL